MGCHGLICRRNMPPILTFFTLLFVASASATTYTQLERRERWHMGIDQWQMSRRLGGDQSSADSGRRKLLSGPGSSPPSCRSKCGRCSPCYPVHVPVQPGMSKPMEYYPEAWRCKCGGNIFMPQHNH